MSRPRTPDSSSASGGRRALLAGGSGLVGSALLDALLQAREADPANPDRQQPLYRSIQALRRRETAGQSQTRVNWHSVDFHALPVLPEVDDVYIALGTTIKQAGSESAFRQVDLDAVLATARAARAAGASRLAVVSALGADAGSRVFYNRVKGEMEAAVSALGFETLVIAQPSLLLGDRDALGQPKRRAEQFGIRILRPMLGLVPKAVRPIAASTVARAMLRVMREAQTGITVLKSGDLQCLGS